MNLIGGLGLKKFVSIEESPAVESRSRCDTTTGDDNELFWTEKFIVLGGVNSRRAHVRFTPESGYRATRLACPLCAITGIMRCNKSRVHALRKVGRRRLCGEWITAMEIFSFASLGEIDVINNSRQND
jgi:hypothetical protein